MKKIKLLIVLSFTLSSSACFIKQKDITNIIFPVSMMISNLNNKYQIYLLVLSYSLSTRVELESSLDNSLYAVIKIEDSDFSKASEKIGVINEGHVSAMKLRSIVLHSSIFENENFNFKNFSSYIISNPLYKSNIYLYYTNEDPLKLYDLTSLTYTLDTDFYLTRPDKHYFNDFLSSINLVNASKSYLDHHRMFYIPSLAVSEDTFYEQKGNDLKMSASHYQNGALFLTRDSSFTFHDITQIKGLKWKEAKEYFDYEINELSMVHFKIEKSKWSTSIKDKTIKVNASYIAKIIYNYSDYSISQLEAKLKSQIKNEIIETYNNLSYSIDIYQFSDYSYRKNKTINDGFDLNLKVTIKNTIYEY